MTSYLEFDFTPLKTRFSNLSSARKTIIGIFVIDYIFYFVISFISLFFLIIHKEVFTHTSDDIKLPSIIFVSLITLGLTTRIIYIKPLHDNFDNNEVDYKKWAGKIFGNSYFIHILKIISILFGTGLWIAGWIFISSSGGVIFKHFQDEYYSVSILMILYWIYISLVDIIIVWYSFENIMNPNS
jgi:hypothetical protein